MPVAAETVRAKKAETARSRSRWQQPIPQQKPPAIGQVFSCLVTLIVRRCRYDRMAWNEMIGFLAHLPERMRANMARVPPTSDTYKRYLKKFDEQETEIERRQAELAKLQKAVAQVHNDYDAFVGSLTAE